MKTTYVAVYPEVRRDDVLCRVHAPGCKDLDKARVDRALLCEEELDLDAEDHTANMLLLDPDELGYGWHDVQVMRCATNHANRTRRAAARTAAQTPAKATRARRTPTTPGPDPQPTSDEYSATIREALGTATWVKDGFVVTTTEYTRRKMITAGLFDKTTRHLTELGQQVAGVTPPATGARKARATDAGRARRNGPAQAEAAAQADKIIADAVATVQARGDKVITAPGRETPIGTPESAVWAAARLATCDDDTYALAVEVRKLRGAGEAWWRIAHTMSLPGSGPSVAQGKTGAAHARRLWARAWGNTYSDTTAPRETKAIKKERALVSPGRPFFPNDTPDAEVISTVRGREITWCTRLAAGDSVVVSLQQAKVSDTKIAMAIGPKGRVINFNEVIKDERGTELVGPRRSVYLERIEKVGA